MDDSATGEDAAWASVETPLSVEALKDFCADIERLYRINPMLEFRHWEAGPDNRFVFSGRNISQEPPFDFEFGLSATRRDDGVHIDYDRGIKSSTTFTIEPAAQGSRLTITDRYERLPAEQRSAHLHEVDKSLVVWAQYLQQYMINWQRWSRFGPWRWYMRRVWQPMKPAGRRITYILLWITTVEIALIALGVAVYFAEYADS
ncbi:MAG TPA: hypothetical protein ENJ80_05135 [Gammaproteobacteria bacterium]|nr:hypothetical protein [Gammaproteobacteria bacterium]